MKNFSLIEKLAIIKSLDEIIMANGEIAAGEESFLKEVMTQFEFRTDLVHEARQMKFSDSIDIRSKMPSVKKRKFAEVMHQMAISDGQVDAAEANLIIHHDGPGVIGIVFHQRQPFRYLEYHA